MSPQRRIAWKPIEALAPASVATNGAFAALEALEKRAPELYELLDEGLSVALLKLQSQI